MDTNKDTKQPATSAPASTSNPAGAVRVSVSSMKGKQAFQKTKLTSGPSYYPEEDDEEQRLPSSLELESESSERATAKFHNEKADAELKQAGKAKNKKKTIADGELKSRSQRQENRWSRISSRTLQEDTTPPPSISPSQDLEQDRVDEDEENPGAARVAGMNSIDSPAVPEDDLAMERVDSTSRMDGMRNERISTAHLVAEEDTEMVAQQERGTIEEEARQQLLGEMGKVERAEVVEDDGSKPRRRAFLCAAMVVILSAIILGSVLGTRDNTSPNIHYSSVDKDSCVNAFGPITRAEVIPGSTSSGATVDIEAPSCGSASEPTTSGVWYNIIGDGGAIVASTCDGTNFDTQISVFTGSCGQLTCVDGSDNACGSQSLVEFQSIENQTYHVLVHGYGNSTGTFSLQIIFTRLSDLFVKYKVSIHALQDPASPQYLALAWMADNDSPDLQSTLSDDELVERFALVLVYFATGGGSWLNQAGFLTLILDTCSWNSIVDGSRVLGVDCNDEGHVVTLDLCKCLKPSTC
jgi:hypothetical protein